MAAAQRAFETRMSRVVGIQSEPCTTATCDALPRIRKVNAVLEDLSRGRTRATAPAAGTGGAIWFVLLLARPVYWRNR